MKCFYWENQYTDWAAVTREHQPNVYFIYFIIQRDIETDYACIELYIPNKYLLIGSFLILFAR